MVVVIGQSAARAFGLVGLGGFIRFRSGIKDTRDAAVMFVMIGIGMACGAGRGPDGGRGDVVRERRAGDLRRRPPRAPAHDEGLDPCDASRGAAWERIRLAFPGARVLELPGPATDQAGKLVMETALADDMDAAGVMRLLQDKQVPGINSVSIDDNGKGGVT